MRLGLKLELIAPILGAALWFMAPAVADDRYPGFPAAAGTYEYTGTDEGYHSYYFPSSQLYYYYSPKEGSYAYYYAEKRYFHYPKQKAYYYQDAKAYYDNQNEAYFFPEYDAYYYPRKGEFYFARTGRTQRSMFRATTRAPRSYGGEAGIATAKRAAIELEGMINGMAKGAALAKASAAPRAQAPKRRGAAKAKAPRLQAPVPQAPEAQAPFPQNRGKADR